MEPKRSLPDLFLNTNNATVSEIFGYNNNVAMGNRNCIYYVTLYNTKGNQEEEQLPFLRICTAIAKRLRKLRNQETQLAKELRNEFQNEESVNPLEPNFKVGLGHVLSGIMAHLSSTILSATMAWHLVIKDSRFQFSHDFSTILLSQFESWLLGNDIQFRYRRNKNKETGWIDSNLFQYIYRPEQDDFDRVCVWEYFMHYEMRLISSLSMNQKENLESDFEENLFFRFTQNYPGYEFACVEKLRHVKVPMLYYKDHIPDLANCDISSNDDMVDVDAATKNVRNDYATKMLLLFYPFRERNEFPLFEERWNFFLEAHENGSLYWDATRIMQNIQDVENSKKIISKQEPSEALGNQETDSDIEPDEISEIQGCDDDYQGTTLKPLMNQVQDDDLDMIFEEYGVHGINGGSLNFEVAKNASNNLARKMKKEHVIHDPVTSNESACIQKASNIIGQDSCHTDNDSLPLPQSSTSGSVDIIKVILNLDRNVENHEPKWEELEQKEVLNFEEFPLAMKSCISHYKLDLKQAAAFNVICSTFMLAHLEDPSLEKLCDKAEIERAKEMLLAKGGLGKLVMNLTGSGGSGKSFVLNATKSFCRQFCKVIGKPFNDSVFIVTATTNTAAADLQGDTIHSIAGLRRKLSRILKDWSLNWVLAKILFIDEISMMDIMDFLKLDKYLRRLMAQFNPDALNYPFGGLNIVFCGDFSQLNPVGQKDVIYDQSRNALWSMINRVINLTMTNWRFKEDPKWGELLQRVHHGETGVKDMELINTRVIGPNLSLPTFEELQGAEITYACYTNADRNLITDNIFASILENRHPTQHESFDIPEQTIMIKGLFCHPKTNEAKSSSYHNLIHGNCGDDNVQCGNGQNIIRVDPCLKLFVGCPIMVSVNDFKKFGVVKGTTGIFKGIVLKDNKTRKVEIWNGYKVYTVDACDVDYIVCEYRKKKETDPTRTFKVPAKAFEVTTKFPIQNGKSFLKLAKSRITQFPINNDLATTGHKLQGKTKKYLIVSQFNYSTPNWIYVVLSRVTTLEGLFLLQPIKSNYNPQPSKLLKEEWKRQRDQEVELLLFLQQSGNFPQNIDVLEIALKIGNHNKIHGNIEGSDFLPNKSPKRKKTKKDSSFATNLDQATSTLTSKYDSWFLQNNMKIQGHLSRKNGNCLFDSVASHVDDWRGKSFELRLTAISWAQNQISQGTSWGISMWRNFENTKANKDCYNMHSYMQYLEHMKNLKVFGTEYDIIMLCEFLQVSIKVFSPSLFFGDGNLLQCNPPPFYGDQHKKTILLWLSNLHYEPIFEI